MCIRDWVTEVWINVGGGKKFQVQLYLMFRNVGKKWLFFDTYFPQCFEIVFIDTVRRRVFGYVKSFFFFPFSKVFICEIRVLLDCHFSKLVSLFHSFEPILNSIHRVNFQTASKYFCSVSWPIRCVRLRFYSEQFFEKYRRCSTGSTWNFSSSWFKLWERWRGGGGHVSFFFNLNSENRGKMK